MRKIFAFIIVVLVVVFFIILFSNRTHAPTLNDRSGSSDSNMVNEEIQKQHIQYSCDQGDIDMYLSGEDYGDAEIFTEEEMFNLYRVTSSSGTKYASSDQKIVFWSRGFDAFIQKDNEIIYENCAEK